MKSITMMKGHTDTINCLTYSQNGHLIATGSADKTIRIWDAFTGILRSILRGHTSLITYVSFSCDGSYLLSASGETSLFFPSDHRIRKWNVSTNSCELILEGHEETVYSVSFFQNKEKIISGSDDKKIRIWNALTGTTESIFDGRLYTINSRSYSLNKNRIVSHKHDFINYIWDESASVLKRSEKYMLYNTSYSLDRAHLVDPNYSDKIEILDAFTGKTVSKLDGNRQLIYSMSFSFDKCYIVAHSNLGEITIWSASSGAILHTLNVDSIDEEDLDLCYGAISVSFFPNTYNISMCYGNNIFTFKIMPQLNWQKRKDYATFLNTLKSLYAPDASIKVFQCQQVQRVICSYL